MNKKTYDHIQDRSGYLSTAQAAALLGVSLGTVQQMVEDGLLQAWKTAGGHRRIHRESVLAYLEQHNITPPPSSISPEVRVLVAEDEEILQTLYASVMKSWNLPMKIKLVSNGIDGLVSIGRDIPDVLIVDLMLPGIDGFDMVRVLRSNPALIDMDIIVVSGLDEAEIAARGGLPHDVTHYPKPIPFPELRGYFQAKTAEKQKQLRARGKSA